MLHAESNLFTCVEIDPMYQFTLSDSFLLDP